MVLRRAGGRSILVAMLAMAAGCGGDEPKAPDDPSKRTITLRSPAFEEGGMIPKEHTCDGVGMSPALEWSGVPEGAKELALIVDDPDAPMGTFSHWVVVALPPRVEGLKANAPSETILPAASMAVSGEGEIKGMARQGKNDFGKVGYGGPCPPSGSHRYIFRLYALDAPLGASTGAPTRAEVLRAIEGHIIAEGRLTGRYARSK